MSIATVPKTYADKNLVVALGTIPLHVPGPDGWVPMG